MELRIIDVSNVSPSSGIVYKCRPSITPVVADIDWRRSDCGKVEGVDDAVDKGLVVLLEVVLLIVMFSYKK